MSVCVCDELMQKASESNLFAMADERDFLIFPGGEKKVTLAIAHMSKHLRQACERELNALLCVCVCED
jgi:hypothetical protein